MTLHRIEPDHYYNSFGSHAPIITLSPGDTVVTSIIDAFGVDSEGRQVTSGPNPQTGPFFISGAEPGDTLIVNLDRISPNRRTGRTRSTVSPNVVDPNFARTLPESQLIDWVIDPENSKAWLASPMLGLERLSLPLQPMLGCLGVAPADGQIISSATSGPYGGNMDYRGFKAGATAYFPVFVPGALLHLGDGHAVQGDGEIVGTGIETSFEVQFTVDLRKGKRIQWPRGENDEFIFTAGNARPLDQAVQHATTEMLIWLYEDFGLDISAASTLLGMCVDYDLGNIFDPAYTMVCKISKQALKKYIHEK